MTCKEHIVACFEAAASDEPAGAAVVTLHGDENVTVRFGCMTPPMMVAAGLGVFLEMNNLVFVENAELVSSILSAPECEKAVGLVSSIMELGRQLSEILLGEPVPKPERMDKETLN